MFRIIIETTYESPLTQADLDAEAQCIASCIQAYDIYPMRMFVSRDRRRTLCELDASDTDTVRVACRQADIPFDRLWAATVLEFTPEVAATLPAINESLMVRVLVERTHDPPLTEALLQSVAEKPNPCFEARKLTVRLGTPLSELGLATW